MNLLGRVYCVVRVHTGDGFERIFMMQFECMICIFREDVSSLYIAYNYYFQKALASRITLLTIYKIPTMRNVLAHCTCAHTNYKCPSKVVFIYNIIYQVDASSCTLYNAALFNI